MTNTQSTPRSLPHDPTPSTATSSSTTTTTKTNVLIVHRRNAKTVKTFLEQIKGIDKRYRMTQVIDDLPSQSSHFFFDDSTTTRPEVSSLIAIPITDDPSLFETMEEIKRFVLGRGIQSCPRSTSALGNPASFGTMTPIQRALLDSLFSTTNANRDDSIRSILELDAETCPKTLEQMGNNDTLIIPRKALTLRNPQFQSLCIAASDDDIVPSFDEYPPNHKTDVIYLKNLWKMLGSIYNCQRVVRKGEIHPDSRIRESGHRILWPDCGSDDGIPEQTGPNSPGWITIIEQTILQSFDLTRIMFSRGNISEKIRFGTHLVQPNETILDMYAGIGYYTLPALMIGRAHHVHACEWNPNALMALHYNLNQNGLKHKATIYEGDCRRQMDIVKGQMDRVILGLLPSSEGGWPMAVNALRDDIGGWIHIHGNVPANEKDHWTIWVCQSILKLVDNELFQTDWIVVCHHVEKVKSFAPRVNHYVADLFVGPRRCWDQTLAEIGDLSSSSSRMGVVHENGVFVPCCEEVVVEPPSCALSSNGILYRQWMME